VTVAQRVTAEMEADCLKAQEKAAKKAEAAAYKAAHPAAWSIPVTFGYLHDPDLSDVTYVSGGPSYRPAGSKLAWTLQGTLGRRDSLDIAPTPDCCCAQPSHFGSKTIYGAAVTLTIPLK
jgi:hypothetical protein